MAKGYRIGDLELRPTGHALGHWEIVRWRENENALRHCFAIAILDTNKAHFIDDIVEDESFWQLLKYGLKIQQAHAALQDYINDQEV